MKNPPTNLGRRGLCHLGFAKTAADAVRAAIVAEHRGGK
jgi:hypothetical protein